MKGKSVKKKKKKKKKEEKKIQQSQKDNDFDEISYILSPGERR